MSERYTASDAQYLADSEPSDILSSDWGICDYCHTYYDGHELAPSVAANVAHMNSHCAESPNGEHEFGLGDA